jgi:hypothetical protein
MARWRVIDGRKTEVKNMDDLDAALAKLARAPMPMGLDAFESRVLESIRAQPIVRSGLGLSTVAILAAVTMGITGANVHDKQAQSVGFFTPLGPSLPLAPSTLLASGP